MVVIRYYLIYTREGFGVFNMLIPEDVSKVIKQIEGAGFKAYLAGGCVRDSVLNGNPKDYDIATDAKPTEIEEIFHDKKTLDVGKRFGTIILVLNNRQIEITSFRADGTYSDGRRPDSVMFSKDVKEDVARRDFTINAMVYNEEEGLIDLFGGREDLEKRIVRTVGKPDDRFNEDYLRMLRCIRFATRLDFQIEEETYKSIIKNAEKISKVSKERIRDEFLKILISDYPGRGIELLIETDLYKYIFPSVKSIDDIKVLNEVLIKSEKDELLRLAILFKFIGDGKDLELLRPSNDEKLVIKEVLKFDFGWSYSLEDVKRIMRDIPDPVLGYIISAGFIIEKFKKNMIDFKEKREYIISNSLPYKISDLKIDGEDLKKLGFEPGPSIGDKLKELNELVIREPEKNNKEFLLEYISEVR